MLLAEAHDHVARGLAAVADEAAHIEIAEATMRLHGSKAHQLHAGKAHGEACRRRGRAVWGRFGHIDFWRGQISCVILHCRRLADYTFLFFQTDLANRTLKPKPRAALYPSRRGGSPAPMPMQGTKRRNVTRRATLLVP